MNILITTTDSYVPYAGVLLQSLKDSNPEMELNVFIVSCDITDNNSKKLKRLFDSADGKHTVHFPVISDMLMQEISEITPYLPPNFNISFTLRLYSAQVLPPTLHQVLYIDVDTIITSSLVELDKIVLDENTALAAVKDFVRYDDYERLQLDKELHVYFNAGVMLLNLDYWRKYNIGQKAIGLLKEKNIYKFLDQDVLNVLCAGHVIYLHPRYNCMMLFYALPQFVRGRVWENEWNRVKEAVQSPAVIHFVFLNKPWFKGCFLPKRDLWLATLRKTEWNQNVVIRYRNGFKGWLKETLKSISINMLPLIGLQSKYCIFEKKRYRYVELLSLLIYYGFAYWLPNFDSRFGGKFFNRLRVFLVKNIFSYVGENVNIGRKVRFGNGRKVSIGNRSNIGENCIVPHNIIIGDDVMMGPNNFFFGSFTHNISDVTKPMIEQGFLFFDAGTEISDDVWIGRDCLFMPCIKIGTHSVVGARSVVTKNVPDKVIVAGNPARVRKDR